jgi:hypothetical protein
MDGTLLRIWEDLGGRIDGPLFFRFILQPLIAATLGFRAGVADARAHQVPYAWRVLSHPSERWNLIRMGLKDVGKVFLLAVVLDIVYQYIVFRWVYPFETLLVAITLSIVPYLLVRGVVTRVVSVRLAPSALSERSESNGPR